MAAAAPLRIVPGVYAYVGVLPPGCQLCIQGVKMVVFITGLCSERCFYCPVSPNRLYHDKVFADEEPAHRLTDFVDEAYRVAAGGASITGGDPLVRLKRTLKTIKLLKDVFGPEFHIHLYTSGRYATRDALVALERAGLDEIRFHPVEEWMKKRIELAIRVLRNTRVGAEVPVIPGRVEELKSFIAWLDSIGAEFINLNELEVSERNIRGIITRGLRPDPSKPVVKGSEEAGLELVRWASREKLRITVHYCPAAYKDRVQLRARLLRKALRLRRPYEEVTSEGMLLYAEAPVESLPAGLAGDAQVEQGLARLPPALAPRIRGAALKQRYPSPKAYNRLPVNVERVAEEG